MKRQKLRSDAKKGVTFRHEEHYTAGDLVRE